MGGQSLYTDSYSNHVGGVKLVWLTKEEQDRIDSKIYNEVIKKTGKTTPKNSILEIVTSLGVDVFLVDFDQKFPQIKKNLSGMIEYPKRTEKAKIFLNSKDTPERRSFTLAHELGHFLLHKPDVQGRFRLDYQIYIDDQQSKEETEANYFAASLLVLKERLLAIMKEINIFNNMSQVADYFGVSELVIRNRLEWLKRNE